MYGIFVGLFGQAANTLACCCLTARGLAYPQSRLRLSKNHCSRLAQLSRASRLVAQEPRHSCCTRGSPRNLRQGDHHAPLMLLFLLAFLGTAGAFAYFNQEEVTIRFLDRSLTAPMGLVIAGAFALGHAWWLDRHWHASQIDSLSS